MSEIVTKAARSLPTDPPDGTEFAMSDAKTQVFRPFILGSGGSAQAIEGALGLLQLSHPRWQLERPVKVARTTKLSSLVVDPTTDFLCLANPHALHARRLIEALEAGFRRIVTEKPIATSSEDLGLLKALPEGVHVGVFHGYRALWGPRDIRRRIEAGLLGKVFAVEGRYWQSSAAQVAVGEKESRGGWKNDRDVSGPYDVALDLGTHWVNLAAYLAGGRLRDGIVRRGFANAEAPHRDTHVTMDLAFEGDVRSLASVSKTVHGAVNDLDVVVHGTHGSAAWSFTSPDVLVLGRGSERLRVTRPAAAPTASKLPVGHGLGWLDGYAAVLEGFLEHWDGPARDAYPSLEEVLPDMETYLRILERSV